MKLKISFKGGGRLMTKKTKKRIIVIFGLLFIIVAIYFLLPIIKQLMTEEGRLLFKNKVDDLGIWGLLILTLLQLLQILLVFFPGEPLEILAGMCYGGFFGTLFIMISSFVFSALIFLLVRKYGKNFLYLFFKKEKIDKLLNSKIFRNPKKIELVMLLLFLIPGTPKDMLVYIAGLLPIKTVNFLVISSIARFPSVISGVLAGSSFMDGNIFVSIIIYGITFLLVGLIIYIINKIDKDKTTNKILKTFD